MPDLETLEARLAALAESFETHALREQEQTERLQATLKTLITQMQAVYEVMGNLAGTPSNFMHLAEEIKGARGLGKRGWKVIAWLGGAVTTITLLTQCLWKGDK